MALLPELDVRSVLHVVEENFERVNLKAFAIRMIYTGEHALKREQMIEHFKKTVKDVNSSYCEIPLTGLLLVYDSYFVHILEGSEDTVHRQIRFLLKREEDYIEQMTKKDEEEAEGLAALEPEAKPERKMFKRLKMLMLYHCIASVQFDQWYCVPARPPTLVTRLDVFAPMAQHMEQLKVCLVKLAKLAELATEDETFDFNFEGLSAVDPRMEALPEVALLDFLLQSPHVFDLRWISYMHRRVDDYRFYFEEVWPLPTHYTPRHLYKLKIDDSFVEPLPVMPWELVGKKEKENEDEDEERESGSESSD